MKKKTKSVLLAAVCCLTLASCGTSITTPLAATSNPVGNRCGESSYKTYFWGLFGKRHANVGIDQAVKNGGITRISHVDQQRRCYGFFGSRHQYITKVYGE